MFYAAARKIERWVTAMLFLAYEFQQRVDSFLYVELTNGTWPSLHQFFVMA